MVLRMYNKSTTLSKAELIALLQDSEVPDDAPVMIWRGYPEYVLAIEDKNKSIHIITTGGI